jgi:hypothetical protein
MLNFIKRLFLSDTTCRKNLEMSKKEYLARIKYLHAQAKYLKAQSEYNKNGEAK